MNSVVVDVERDDFALEYDHDGFSIAQASCTPIINVGLHLRRVEAMSSSE